jgi:hypothetical protein
VWFDSRIVGIQLEFVEYDVFVAIPIPSKMNFFNFYLIEIINFFFGEQSAVKPLIKVNHCFAIDELLEQVSPISASKDVRVAKDYIFCPFQN